jgi:hypothetical protein
VQILWWPRTTVSFNPSFDKPQRTPGPFHRPTHIAGTDGPSLFHDFPWWTSSWFLLFLAIFFKGKMDYLIYVRTFHHFNQERASSATRTHLPARAAYTPEKHPAFRPEFIIVPISSDWIRVAASVGVSERELHILPCSVYSFAQIIRWIFFFAHSIMSCSNYSLITSSLAAKIRLWDCFSQLHAKIF